MIFAAKCYWPDITAAELTRAARRAARQAELARHRGSALAYLGSILFPDDELVLCLVRRPLLSGREGNQRACRHPLRAHHALDLASARPRPAQALLTPELENRTSAPELTACPNP
jgi:hypothetical protein